MDYDKLIEHLRECGTYGFKQEECRDAAIAIETLRAENRRLNEVICSIPTTPDSGRTIGQYDKEMSMCAYLDDLEAENKSLRAALARVTAERDAAISDLTCIARTYPVELCDDLVCQYCKHYPNINAGCPGWTDDDCFEWRGIEED